MERGCFHVGAITVQVAEERMVIKVYKMPLSLEFKMLLGPWNA